jgi:hypothetical protein
MRLEVTERVATVGAIFEAEYRHQRDQGDGECSELVRAEQAGEHNADGQGADPGRHVVGEAPAQRP